MISNAEFLLLLLAVLVAAAGDDDDDADTVAAMAMATSAVPDSPATSIMDSSSDCIV